MENKSEKNIAKKPSAIKKSTSNKATKPLAKKVLDNGEKAQTPKKEIEKSEIVKETKKPIAGKPVSVNKAPKKSPNKAKPTANKKNEIVIDKTETNIPKMDSLPTPEKQVSVEEKIAMVRDRINAENNSKKENTSNEAPKPIQNKIDSDEKVEVDTKPVVKLQNTNFQNNKNISTKNVQQNSQVAKDNKKLPNSNQNVAKNISQPVQKPQIEPKQVEPKNESNLAKNVNNNQKQFAQNQNVPIKQNPNQNQKFKPNQVQHHSKPEIAKQQSIAKPESKPKVFPVNSKDNRKNPNQGFVPKQQSQNKNVKPQAQAPQNKVKQSELWYLPNEKLKIDYLNDKTIVGKLISKIDKFLSTKLFVDNGSSLMVAVSGGIDSVVLLDILVQLAFTKRFKINVVHYNHKLRKDSDIDENFVRDLCEHYAVSFATSSGDVKKYAETNSLSIEAAGRQLRYKFFERISGINKSLFVCTAHHAGDSVETFLMNLFRGTGLSGLVGIPAKRQFTKNTFLIRPLSELNKSEIEEYAKARELKHRHDESNDSLDFTRNKIRKELIPLIEREFNNSASNNILRASKAIAGAEKLVTTIVNDTTESLAKKVTGGRVIVNAHLLETYSEFLQGEIILSILQNNFSYQVSSSEMINNIIGLANKETGSKVEIGNSLIVGREREYLVFNRVEKLKNVNYQVQVNQEYKFNEFDLKLEIVDKASVEYDENRLVEYFEADYLPKVLEIRTWRQSDYMKPLGMKNEVKIGDMISNAKINTIDRAEVLVLTDKVNILWALGIRIAETHKINTQTEKVLKVEIIPKKINYLRYQND